MNVLRQIEVAGNQRNRSQDSSDRNRTHSLNEEALRKYEISTRHTLSSLLLYALTMLQCFMWTASY